MRINKNSVVDSLNTENACIDRAIDQNYAQITNLQNALSNPQCSSVAYYAIADRIRNLRIPVAQAHNIIFEGIRGGNSTNIAAINSLPETSGGVLDTDECDQKINELRQQNGTLESLHQNYLASLSYSGSYSYYFTGFQNLIAVNNGIIADYEAKKQAAFDYAAQSASFYSSVKQQAENLLQQSTNSINSYLTNGSYGSTLWKGGIASAYKAALNRQKERLLLELSNQEGGIAILSEDKQYFYYKGVKWEIAQYEGAKRDQKVYIKAVFSEVDSVYFEGDILLRWTKLLSGYSMTDLKMNAYDDSGHLTGKRFSKPVGTMGTVIDLSSNLINALDRAWIKLVFSCDGVNNKVTILGGSASQIDSERSSMGAGTNNGINWPVPLSPSFIKKSSSWEYCNSVYEDMTGEQLDQSTNYTLYFRPDRNRGIVTSENYYDVIYYDDNGDMRSIPRGWPDDQYEIRGSDGSVVDCGSYIAQSPQEANEDYRTILESTVR